MMTTFAVPLDASKVERIRELIAKLKDERHEKQFSDRARQVGYTRESHHLQPMPDGSTLMLVHLEFDGDFAALQRRLEQFASDDDFDTWWTREYVGIARFPSAPDSAPGLGLPPIETLFTWTDEDSFLEIR